MGVAASLLFLAAAAVQVSAPESTGQSASIAPIAVQARASARILAGAEVRFGREDRPAKVTSEVQPQVRRDSVDSLWVEFS